MTCIVTVQSQLCAALIFNDFPLPFRRVRNQSCQNVRLRPAVHKLNSSTFI